MLEKDEYILDSKYTDYFEVSIIALFIDDIFCIGAELLAERFHGLLSDHRFVNMNAIEHEDMQLVCIASKENASEKVDEYPEKYFGGDFMIAGTIELEFVNVNGLHELYFMYMPKNYQLFDPNIGFFELQTSLDFMNKFKHLAINCYHRNGYELCGIKMIPRVILP